MKLSTYRYLLLLLLIGLTGRTFAQNFEYGNAWYKSNPNASYVKLVVKEDGIYRVSLQDLFAAGHDLSSVDATRLRLFYRGEEVPIFVSRTGTSLVYFEFFGKKNDGRVDSVMYRHPLTGAHEGDLQPSKEISLFTDESAYFLTWGTQPGQRLFSVFNPAYGQFTAETSFPYVARKEYKPNQAGTEYIVGGGGTYDPNYTLNSDYVTGEGYVGNRSANGGYFGIGEPVTVTIPTPLAASTGNPIQVRTRVFGRSNTAHILQVAVNGNTSNLVLDTATTSGVYIKTFTRNYTVGSNLTANTLLTFSAKRETTDNNNVCWSEIRYDRQPDLAGDSIVWIRDWDKTTEAYFRFNNMRGQDTLFAYDFTNRIRHKGLITGTGATRTANMVLIGSNDTRDVYFASDKAIKKPIIAEAKLNRLFDVNNTADYIIITHRDLAASALAFAQYRDTATVNDVTVKVVYTDEIYDEFGYGSITPWAIKRFCKYAIDNYQVAPKYFMLWGKGTYDTRRADYPVVPTYGYPATDYEFVGHFDPTSISLSPEAAIGRLNIYNDTEGLAFLNKVNEYEHQPWDVWMKEGVFLGGGATAGEQSAIEAGFSQMVTDFAAPPTGGGVYYYQKSSSNTIDPTTATYHDEISKGVSQLHFFGHSTSNIQDINIREAYEYYNVGRYPVMIAMGCYGGDFAGEESFGERWVKTPNKGSICYIANSSAGYLNPLRDFGIFYYAFRKGPTFGQSLGDIMKYTITKYTDSLTDIYHVNHGRQLNLQGDPAVIPHTPKKPDLEVTAASVFFTPTDFTSQADSFTLNVIVQNKGLATADSFSISIRQRPPSGGNWIDMPLTTLPMVAYKDTFSFNIINTLGNQLTGLNVFEITLDPANELDEYREDNNQVLVNRVIPGNIPAILYPYDFAVVGKANTKLQASSFFMSQEENIGYVFEIDSTSTFESTFKINSGVIRGKAVHVAWEVPFSLQDSMVYYWRVRLADVAPNSWQSASFRYIQNRTGWGQAKMAQFAFDENNRVTPNTLQNKWVAEQFGKEYEISSGPGNYFSYSVNGAFEANLGLNGYYADGIGFLVIDQYTLDNTYNSEWGPLGVAAAPSELYRLKDAIAAAKQGDYIILGSNRNPNVQLWPQDVLDALTQIGVSEAFHQLGSNQPFLIIGRKGYPGSATENYSIGSNGKIQITKILFSNYPQATVKSPRIGPALRWDELYWTWKSPDLNPGDESIRIKLYGIRADDTDSLIMDTKITGLTSLDSLDAKAFPYARMEATFTDSVLRTPPQLRHWHLLYDPVPEAIVDPVTAYEFRSDTIFDGQEISIKMGSFNITEVPMDSLLVQFTLVKSDRSRVVVDQKRFAPLPGDGNTVPFEFSFPSKGKDLNGLTTLIVEINANKDQPELYAFNNLYEQDFFVVVDKINPVLDVTFDGKHIITGDIVSPQPEILVEVNDENSFVALDDTGAFELYLRKGLSPATSFERIFVSSDPRVQIVPGQLPENKAQLFFFPGKITPLTDGNYTLRVQGRDQVGNTAAKTEAYYEINFEVVSKSTVTQVLNYPNPFSTSTRFVYTLTGAETPELFQIHIYTISGKMVKVIDLLELGEAKVGKNITNYAWDGTDDYGDRLANGVYLYRVVTKYQGQQFEMRDEGVDKYFNNGWGKMVIMR